MKIMIFLLTIFNLSPLLFASEVTNTDDVTEVTTTNETNVRWFQKDLNKKHADLLTEIEYYRQQFQNAPENERLQLAIGLINSANDLNSLETDCNPIAMAAYYIGLSMVYTYPSKLNHKDRKHLDSLVIPATYCYESIKRNKTMWDEINRLATKAEVATAKQILSLKELKQSQTESCDRSKESYDCTSKTSIVNGIERKLEETPLSSSQK